MRIRIDVLGGFKVLLRSSVGVSFPTRKGQALVAYLAMHRGQPQSRDKLATLLWGNSGEEQSRHSLRQTLLSIRKSFGEASPISSEGGMLMLDETAEVDAIEFSRFASSSNIAQVRQAAELYSGPFLDGINVEEEGFEEWLFLERERLRQLCVQSLRALVDHFSSSGESEQAIQGAVKLLSLDPLQESIHRSLMQLYIRTGRREAALRQYQICAHLLDRELGMEPEEETKELHRSIAQQSARGQNVGLPAEAAERRSILVVEDDPVTRALIQVFLTEGGFDVVEAEDGASALLLLPMRRFSLVLLDLNMPLIDGLALLDIMAHKGLQVPTVCLTSASGSQSEVASFQLGAVDFIRKPVKKDILLMRVNNALRMHEAASQGVTRA